MKEHRDRHPALFFARNDFILLSHKLDDAASASQTTQSEQASVTVMEKQTQQFLVLLLL
jgi:hypothetical protein